MSIRVGGLLFVRMRLQTAQFEPREVSPIWSFCWSAVPVGRGQRLRRVRLGAARIIGRRFDENPTVSAWPRGREILRVFSDAGAAQIAGTQSHVNPGCLPRTYGCQFRLGGRGNRPARNFWPCDEDRVRGTPRTCRGFCRGFFGPRRGRSESSAGRLRETSGCGPCAWPKMATPRAVWISGACGDRNRPVSLHVRAAKNGYRGLAPWQTAARMSLRGLLFAL